MGTKVILVTSNLKDKLQKAVVQLRRAARGDINRLAILRRVTRKKPDHVDAKIEEEAKEAREVADYFVKILKRMKNEKKSTQTHC